MEQYSSDISPQSREDSPDSRPRSTPRIAGTDSSFTSLNSISASTEPNSNSCATASSSSALGPYHPLGGQAQFSQSRIQVSSSQFTAPLPQFDYHPRYSKPYNSGSPLPIQSSLSQNAGLLPWDYPAPSQEQSSTALLQLNRGINQSDSVARSQYDSGSQQPLQANMSIMGPQYFSGIETSLNRSSHTWPVFQQQQNFTEENRFLEPFSERHAIHRPQSTSSTPPRMISMSLQTQRESRQLHEVRRDSKTRFRRERSHSNSYNPSLSTTPEAVSRPLPLDNYSLGQAASDVAQSRMPIQHFTGPLQLAGHQQTDVYEQQYQLSMPDYPSNYLLPYSTAPLNPPMSSYPSRALPTSSISSPDLGTYYRQTSASSLGSNQSQQHDTAGDPVRVMLTRPKPQCWEHGCNGRAFSTFSNLLRHQREKNGVAAKPTCPNCGAEFTRTTARNGHMAHEKCKKA